MDNSKEVTTNTEPDIKFGKKLKRIIIRIIATVLVFFISVYRRIKPVPPCICFYYDQSIHQIFHSIYVAIELSNIQKEYPVVIYSTSREASQIIEEELSLIPNNVRFVKIRYPGYNKIDFKISWAVFWCRLGMYKPKAVVVTDYFDNVFRQLLVKTFWVYIPHGLVSGEFASDPHIRNYDFVILPGKRDLEELERRIGRLENSMAIGYSKLDYFKYHQVEPRKLFNDSKPVILYNPHFKEQLSSFFNKGLDLLESLSRTGKYNVIFMPHPDLARKHPDLMKKARQIQGVEVICRPKINLDYMMISDIYIADVTSSVFEWLYFNKPVLFFNTKRIKWQNNRYYLTWVLGSVVEDTPVMLEAVSHALGHPEEFQERRKELFNKTFFNNEQNVSKIIANSILQKIKK